MTTKKTAKKPAAKPAKKSPKLSVKDLKDLKAGMRTAAAVDTCNSCSVSAASAKGATKASLRG